MKLAIMQPYFFPYIGYFQAIHSVDKYIIYENLDYIKEGWMHRNRIVNKKGQEQYISAQLQGKSSNSKIRDIRLNSSSVWRRKLKNSLFLNYKNASYFDETFTLIEKVIDLPCEGLHEYNALGIKTIANHLGLTTEIVYENDHYLELEAQLAEEAALARPEDLPTKVKRVLAMCHAEGAQVFINAIGGRVLYDKSVFSLRGIELKFVNSLSIKYPQFSDTFCANLSIIDVLMHNGRKDSMQLINAYELI